MIAMCVLYFRERYHWGKRLSGDRFYTKKSPLQGGKRLPSGDRSYRGRGRDQEIAPTGEVSGGGRDQEIAPTGEVSGGGRDQEIAPTGGGRDQEIAPTGEVSGGGRDQEIAPTGEVSGGGRDQEIAPTQLKKTKRWSFPHRFVG